MTVITLSTVGYDEVEETSNIGRIFTICLIFLGVGFFLYITGAIVQFMVEGRIGAVLGEEKIGKKNRPVEKPLYHLWIWPYWKDLI